MTLRAWIIYHAHWVNVCKTNPNIEQMLNGLTASFSMMIAT